MIFLRLGSTTLSITDSPVLSSPLEMRGYRAIANGAQTKLKLLLCRPG